MPSRLDGKSCIVTGAGAGIGRAIALSFGAEGGRVVVNDVDRSAAETVVKEIETEGGVAIANDEAIGTVAAAEALLSAALEAFGEVDVLVNNAGILRDRMLHKMSEEEFDSVIQVHL